MIESGANSILAFARYDGLGQTVGVGVGRDFLGHDSVHVIIFFHKQCWFLHRREPSLGWCSRSRGRLPSHQITTPMLLQTFILLLHPWKCFSYVQLVDGVNVVDEQLGFGLLYQDVGQDGFLIQVTDDEGGHGGAVVV